MGWTGGDGGSTLFDLVRGRGECGRGGGVEGGVEAGDQELSWRVLVGKGGGGLSLGVFFCV